jgi:phosphatidylglycerophosphate synthase
MENKKVPSIKELRILAKSKRKGFVFILVDYLAYYPAKLFLYTPITPNQITILWAVIQIISTFFLISGEYVTSLIALVIFQSMFILDCADGIVARTKKHFSLNGIYLDNIGHCLATSCLLIFFTIGTFRQQHNLIYILVGLIAVLSYLMNKALTLSPVLYRDDDGKKVVKASRKAYIEKQNKFFVMVFNFLRLEHFLNLLFFGVLFKIQHIVLVIYSGIYFLELMRKLFSQYIMLKKIDQSEN